MPRKYIKKTDRVVNEDDMKKAIRDHLKQGIPVRESARLHNVNRNTLVSRLKNIRRKGKEERYCKESDSGMSSDEDERKFQNKYSVKQVFSRSEEADLVNYLMQCSNLHYGLSYKQIRLLAFEYATRIDKCKFPITWQKNKIAGVDWVYGFMARHPELSLRKPESTSLMRATGFNKDRVTEFFNNYLALLEKYKFKAEKIFNLDETGVSTVMKPVNVVSQKGKKQVGQVASGERGENVTIVGIINAIGNVVPPVYIIPRVRTPEEYITGAPESSLILGNKSGWMTKEFFPKVIEHLKHHTGCTKENQILLLLDNHSSHISLEVIKRCKDLGICLLSFPPHTTHRMQPLDIGIYGPFKSALATAFDDWLVSNPGKTITLRQIGELTNKAFLHSFSSSNIINAFKKPGIWPVNRLAFSDDDFAASRVTDKVNKENLTNGKNINIEENSDKSIPVTTAEDNLENSTPSTSRQLAPQKEKIKIHEIRPYPKCENKKEKPKIKRESKSKIYTSTPIIEELEVIERAKQRKVSLMSSKGTKRKIAQKESDSDMSKFADSSDDNDSSNGQFPLFLETDFIIRENDFVLTKFRTKTSEKYYIGQVIRKDATDYEIKFLRRKNNSHTFAFPIVDDISIVDRDDIISTLPRPENFGTARTASLFKWKINFRGWNIC